MTKKIFFLITFCIFCFSGFAQTTYQKIYGGINSQEGISSHPTADGGYCITGNTSDDIYFLKLDSLGEIQWTKTYGGASSIESGHDGIQTMDGGFIITGTAMSF